MRPITALTKYFVKPRERYSGEQVTSRIFLMLVIVFAGLGLSCRTAASAAPPIVQPGAPGQASRVITKEQAAGATAVRYTDADVRFMQGMIGHHAQALEMAALLPSRTGREDMKLLARRIEVSQSDEIKMMQDWLKARGQDLPGEHARHTLMPGMLTPEEMAKLAAAKGPAFDRLFLELMIKHHDGALTMVKELFASEGAGQESEIFAFASDVDADQRMEIERMTAMLSQTKEPQR
jgi:uncharacterized protein (DUF305 family)